MRRLLAALLVLLAVPASAHVTSTGLATVEVDGGRLSYRLTLVAAEQEEENVRLLDGAANGDTTAAERVAAAMRQAARFDWAGEACTPGRIRFQGSRTGDGKVMLEMALSCPKSAGPLRHPRRMERRAGQPLPDADERARAGAAVGRAGVQCRAARSDHRLAERQHRLARASSPWAPSTS